MPIVGVKRDQLFEALGRTYSTCTLDCQAAAQQQCAPSPLRQPTAVAFLPAQATAAVCGCDCVFLLVLLLQLMRSLINYASSTA